MIIEGRMPTQSDVIAFTVKERKRGLFGRREKIIFEAEVYESISKDGGMYGLYAYRNDGQGSINNMAKYRSLKEAGEALYRETRRFAEQKAEESGAELMDLTNLNILLQEHNKG